MRQKLVAMRQAIEDAAIRKAELFAHDAWMGSRDDKLQTFLMRPTLDLVTASKYRRYRSAIGYMRAVVRRNVNAIEHNVALLVAQVTPRRRP